MHSDSILFVGDIQGCATELEALLEKAQYRPDRHRLVPVGDVINRGPQSAEALLLLKGLGAEPLLGNHELKLLEALENPARASWLERQALSRDLLPHPAFAELEAWIRRWPLFLREPGFVAVHGGLHPCLPLEATPASFLAFVRVCTPDGRMPNAEEWDGGNETIPRGYRPWHAYYQGDAPVIYGHWARQGWNQTRNTWCLDTGCVYGKVLTGLWFPSFTPVVVPSVRPPRKDG